MIIICVLLFCVILIGNSMIANGLSGENPSIKIGTVVFTFSLFICLYTFTSVIGLIANFNVFEEQHIQKISIITDEKISYPNFDKQEYIFLKLQRYNLPENHTLISGQKYLIITQYGKIKSMEKLCEN